MAQQSITESRPRRSWVGRIGWGLLVLVSFGLLPSLVMYKMIASTSHNTWTPYIAFLIAVCSALRLAIFNVDETQHENFNQIRNRESPLSRAVSARLLI